jgi:hypothetical protein
MSISFGPELSAAPIRRGRSDDEKPVSGYDGGLFSGMKERARIAGRRLSRSPVGRAAASVASTTAAAARSSANAIGNVRRAAGDAAWNLSTGLAKVVTVPGALFVNMITS